MDAKVKEILRALLAAVVSAVTAWIQIKFGI